MTHPSSMQRRQQATGSGAAAPAVGVQGLPLQLTQPTNQGDPFSSGAAEEQLVKKRRNDTMSVRTRTLNMSEAAVKSASQGEGLTKE